jgi:hypothetical protein
MTATPQDVQAKIDAAVAQLKQTTQGYVKGSNGNHWKAAMADLAAARTEAGQLVAPAAPTAAFDYKEG